MKTTRENLLQVSMILETLMQKEMKAKGAYGIAKNKKVVEEEVEVLREAQAKIQPMEEYLEFEKQRIDVCKDFSDKDENGEAKTISGPGGGQFMIPDEKKPDFEAKVEELKEEFKEAIEDKDKKEAEWNELLSEEIELDVHVIKIDFLPDNITPAQIDILGEIVSE